MCVSQRKKKNVVMAQGMLDTSGKRLNIAKLCGIIGV